MNRYFRLVVLMIFFSLSSHAQQVEELKASLDKLYKLTTGWLPFDLDPAGRVVLLPGSPSKPSLALGLKAVRLPANNRRRRRAFMTLTLVCSLPAKKGTPLGIRKPPPRKALSLVEQQMLLAHKTHVLKTTKPKLSGTPKRDFLLLTKFP